MKKNSDKVNNLYILGVYPMTFLKFIYTLYVNSIEYNELTSGNRIEIWNKEECKWEIGRIEHRGDYYFYNAYGDNINLYDGIMARKR
jgi:hypothetical protein